MAHAKSTSAWGKETAKERYGSGHEKSNLMSQTSEEAPEDAVDKRAPGYDNRTSEKWLTGAASAEDKPGFDHSRAGEKGV